MKWLALVFEVLANHGEAYPACKGMRRQTMSLISYRAHRKNELKNINEIYEETIKSGRSFEQNGRIRPAKFGSHIDEVKVTDQLMKTSFSTR